MHSFIEILIFFTLPTTATIAVMYSSFMQPRTGCKKWHTAAVVIGSALVYGYVYQFVSRVDFGSMGGFLRTFLNVLAAAIAILLVQMIFDGAWYNKLLTAVLFFVVTMLSEQFLAFILNVDWMNEAGGVYAVSTESLWKITGFFSLAVALIIRLQRRKRDIYVKRTSSFLQISIAVICLLCITILVIKRNLNGSTTIMDIVLLGGLLTLLVLFYISFELTDNINRRNREYALQEQRHALLEEYYRQVEAHQSEVRTIRHDLKNQLLSLAGHIESGDPQKAVRQIDDLISHLSAGDNLRFTAHSGINALLGSKYQQAQAEDIVCDFTVKLPADIAIKDNDLAALVGNVLDNAIEACRYCTGQKYIQFKLVYHGDTLILSSENSTDGNSETATRKGDTLNHGKGLNSIRRTVEQYGGDMQYQFHPGSFSLELTLFPPKA